MLCATMALQGTVNQKKTTDKIYHRKSVRPSFIVLELFTSKFRCFETKVNTRNVVLL